MASSTTEHKSTVFVEVEVVHEEEFLHSKHPNLTELLSTTILVREIGSKLRDFVYISMFMAHF